MPDKPLWTHGWLVGDNHFKPAGPATDAVHAMDKAIRRDRASKGHLARLARDGYPIGLTIAPIQPTEGWQGEYDALCVMAANYLAGIPDLDLTVELITHRFTPKSKDALRGWYPGSQLEMDESRRSRKLTKFGSVKHVYPAALMKEMRAVITGAVTARLPRARVLYWT